MPENTKPASEETKKDAKKYEKLMRSFASAANAMVMYPPGHPGAKRQLEALSAPLNEALKTDDGVSIHLGEGVLVINDINVPTKTKALERVAENFADLKITDLEIDKGITNEELQNFLELFSHAEEVIKMYDSLNEALTKNQVQHIRSLQAAYIRVPKDVKEKMGGKTVGELKISKDEMKKLIAYLKGEIDLSDPKQYSKIFKDPNLISGVVDQIITDSEKQPAQAKQKTIIVVLNQIGKYLSHEFTGSRKQKEAIKVLDLLNKKLTEAKTFISLSANHNFKTQIDQTIGQLKSLVKNQTLITEYNKHRKKIEKLEEKITTVAPQLLADQVMKKLPAALKEILTEAAKLLKKISVDKNITDDQAKEAEEIGRKIDNYLK